MSIKNNTIKLFNIAVDYHRKGNYIAASKAYTKVLFINPKHLQALINLGSVLRSLGQTADALVWLRRAVALAPANGAAWYNLGNAQLAAGLPQAAEQSYRTVINLHAGNAMAWHNLGIALQAQGREAEGRAAYEAACTADPQHRDAWLNLATSWGREGELEKGITCLQQLLAHVPDCAPALNNLATLLQDLGRFDESLQLLQRATELEPELPQSRSNLLMGLQYHPAATVETLAQQARDWGAWATQRAVNLEGAGVLQRPALTQRSGPLKVGYVSADLAAHPVGFFVHDILRQHNRSVVLPYCYSNSTVCDSITEGIRSAVGTDCWRDVTVLDDCDLARLIRDDGIDLLVDLSGHTGKSRLGMFALRPAPVQISWLGYFATTGLPAMDFVILDPYHAPEGAEAQFTEAIIRLPHNRFCYSPAAFAPEPSPPPFEQHGFVTFGSFNNSSKLNAGVLQAWAEILNAVPESRLILKWRTFADQAYCTRIRGFFVGQGIAAGRLEFRTMSVHRELLAEYADIDIALDPFPFSGGHTSCEALWMGVPVVTLPQERVVSRQTWSFLNNIGLPGLAAADRDGYIKLTVSLANSPDTLRDLRGSIRTRMQGSPLCDAPGFTRLLEAAYCKAWEAVQQAGAATAADAAENLHRQGVLAWQQGHLERALMLLRRAVGNNPHVGQYHANLGAMLKGAPDSTAEREACYRRAIALEPQAASYHANLAAVLTEAGRFEEAEAAAREALALDGRRAESWHNLGGALQGQQRWQEAAEAFETALGCNASLYTSALSAGQCRHQLSDWPRATGHYQQACQIRPADLPANDQGHLLHALGQCLTGLFRWSEATEQLQRALQYLPGDLEVLTDLGNALQADGRHNEALACYRQVVAAAPQKPGGWCNLGTVAQARGEYGEAIRCYLAALDRDPGLAIVWGNLGACLTYSPQHSPADVLRTFQKFDELVARPLFNKRYFLNDRNPDRPLRVGYVSPDFRKHPVAYFALPLLEGHHPEEVLSVCYYNHAQYDEWTRQMQAAANEWVPCAGLSDEELAQRILEDRIDILVDLTGHTHNNRLLAFARKPAPLQVTWMGYVTTTGMGTMDWRITHADADPEGMEAFYSEKLWRLSGTMWCYRPLPGMPEVAPPPFKKKGYITFGSFNRYSKNSPNVLEAWGNILSQVPDSRLVICVPEGKIRQDMLDFFAERGVAPERILPFNKLDHGAFWQLHGEVDVALDPFPFGGGTTTCESLWLGVPVVTCTGLTGGNFAPRFASRMGYAFLNNLGLAELAAETVADYVQIAVALAHDAGRLADLRCALRPRMASAPLTDEARFVKEMEEAYRQMWRSWCMLPDTISGGS